MTFLTGISLILAGIFTPIAGFLNIFAKIFWPDLAILQIFNINFANPIWDAILKFAITIPVGIIFGFVGFFLWKLSQKILDFLKKYTKKVLFSEKKSAKNSRKKSKI